MANVIDYVRWRGDLPFASVPFCDVDALVFAELTFLDYSGIIGPDPDSGRKLGEVVEEFFAGRNEEEIRLGEIIPGEIVELFRLCGSAPRFADCRLTAYVNIHDEEAVEQFSAVTFLLPDGTAFIANRGTDDSIVGWKENFQMTFRSPVPAQEHAAGYVSAIGNVFPDLQIRIGGHSKGGNLSVWAASHADPTVRERIVTVFNLDGPGFRPSIEQDRGFTEIRPKIRTVVPECSVVGMFLDHDEKYYAVKSTKKGLLQHDGMSWEVLGSSFVGSGDLSPEFRRVNRLLSGWIDSMGDGQREAFTEAFFSILYSTNASTLTELAEEVPALLRAFSVADAETRQALSVGMRLLLGESKRTVASWLHRHTQGGDKNRRTLPERPDGGEINERKPKEENK